MNIFYLDPDPKRCAEMHCDKHVVKMIIEYAQLLSTAHRILDGLPTVGHSASGRRKTVYRLPDHRDSILYSATHVNHPSAIWVRHSYENYDWLNKMWLFLLEEYTYRYGKVHACARLSDDLWSAPTNIPKGVGFTEPTPAMPDDYKVIGDSVQSYKNYYINAKSRFATWRGKINSREVPTWYSEGVCHA